jgi:hypothetical protein
LDRSSSSPSRCPNSIVARSIRNHARGVRRFYRRGVGPPRPPPTVLTPLARGRLYRADALRTRVDPRRSSRQSGMPLWEGSSSSKFGPVVLRGP